MGSGAWLLRAVPATAQKVLWSLFSVAVPGLSLRSQALGGVLTADGVNGEPQPSTDIHATRSSCEAMSTDMLTQALAPEPSLTWSSLMGLCLKTPKPWTA